MILDTKEKQPVEVKDYPIDYTDWLAEISGGDALSFVSAAVVCVSDATNTALIVDKTVLSSNKTSVWLSAGTNGQKYKVTVTVQTVGGRTDQSEFYVKVKDR